MKRWKMIFPILALFAGSVAGAGEISAFEFEKSIEEQLSRVARVQFGSSDGLAFRVKANFKKQTSVPSESIDAGYMPIPSSAWTAEDEMDLASRLLGLEIEIVASSRLEAKAVEAFRASILKHFADYRPRIKVQTVSYSEPKSDTANSSPSPASEPPADRDQKLTLREWIICAVAGGLLSILGLFFWMGVRSMAQAVQQGTQALGQGLLSLKHSGTVDAGSFAGESTRENSSTDPTRGGTTPFNLEAGLEQLRKFAQTEPLKLVSVLMDGEADSLGLKWLLSQLPDAEQKRLKDFLGEERIRALAKPLQVPKGFQISSWAQELCERVTLRRLEGQAVIERSLSAEDLSFLYQVPARMALRTAREIGTPGSWRLAMEVIPSSLLNEGEALSMEEWSKILKGFGIPSEELRGQFAPFRQKIEAAKVAGETAESDPALLNKILPSLIETITRLPFGRDEEFLEGLRRTDASIAAEVAKRVWTFSDLKRVEPAALKSFIGGLGNEPLFALLISVNESDRDFVLPLIPEGMKRTVVLDLLEKSLAKADAAEKREGLKIARQVLQRALLQNQNGRLPLVKPGAESSVA